MIRKLAARIREYLLAPLMQTQQKDFPSRPLAVDQKSLSGLYRDQYYSKRPPLTFKDVGFRVHSQHEEDGILLFIFSLLGTTNKRCVEICAGDGIECNTANLIINHRWIGLLCDGNELNTEKARQFYSANLDTQYWPPTIVTEWITRGNVNSIIEENGFSVPIGDG